MENFVERSHNIQEEGGGEFAILCGVVHAEYFFLLPNWSGERHFGANISILSSTQCSMIFDRVGRWEIILYALGIV